MSILKSKKRVGSLDSKMEFTRQEPQSPKDVIVVEVKEKSPQEDSANSDKTPTFYQLKYPTMLLRICGLYHRKSDHIALKIYAILLCLIDWSNFARSLSSYSGSDTLSAELFLKIIFSDWLLVVSCTSTIIFINHEISDRYDSLMRNIYSIFEMKIVSIREKVVRKHIYIIYGVTSVFACLNTAGLLVSYFGPKVLYNGFRLFLAPFHYSDWAANCVPLKLCFSALITVTISHWYLPVALYLSHALVVIELLKSFNSTFENFIKNNIIVPKDSSELEKSVPTNQEENLFIENKKKACVCEDSLEKFRLFHLKLAFLVQLLDKCYKEFIAVTILFYTIGILLMFYIMSDWNGNCVEGILTVFYPFWTIVSSIFLLVIIIFAAIINSQVIYSFIQSKLFQYIILNIFKAHAPIEYLFHLEFKDYSNSLRFKVTYIRYCSMLYLILHVLPF